MEWLYLGLIHESTYPALAHAGGEDNGCPAGLFTGLLLRLRYKLDSLGHNRLGELPSGAFQDLANLYHLGLYNNRLAVYHPIVAAVGETGDILDLRLREGQVHTADGGLEFVQVLEPGSVHS